jgi:hypothetical protein
MIRLVKTCNACPEQYDVFDGDEEIGYLRLRWGHFAAHAGGPSGPAGYEALTIGDGVFDPSERDLHLRNAVAALTVKTEYEVVDL